MTTFTLRASEALAGQLNSAEMRSWLEEFLRQPHPLPPDPGSGYGRVSLTLTPDAVSAVATYCKCDISSALRRIAVERLGVKSSSVSQVYRVTGSTGRIPNAGSSHDNSQPGNEIAAAVICFLVWIIFVGIAVVVAFRKGKDT